MAKEKKRIFFVILATIISLVFFTPSISYTENYYWIGDSGLWNDLTNWNPLGPPPLGFSILPEDAAYLVQSDAINRTVSE